MGAGTTTFVVGASVGLETGACKRTGTNLVDVACNSMYEDSVEVDNRSVEVALGAPEADEEVDGDAGNGIGSETEVDGYPVTVKTVRADWSIAICALRASTADDTLLISSLRVSNFVLKSCSATSSCTSSATTVSNVGSVLLEGKDFTSSGDTDVVDDVTPLTVAGIDGSCLSRIAFAAIRVFRPKYPWAGSMFS